MSRILGTQFGVEQREPYPSEVEFFKSDPNIAGMATFDDRVILSPFFEGSDVERQSVLNNERARVFMRTRGIRPGFKVSRDQADRFQDYGSLRDIRETIAARIFSDDPSAGSPTKDQQKFVTRLRREMFRFEKARKR